jgi:hypothetical protein
LETELQFAAIEETMTDTANDSMSPPQQPTADEIAGMKWWNTMTEAERAKALEAAGWRSGSTWTPSAADAWALHKKCLGLKESTDV